MYNFCGKWELIPELSFYEIGEAPTSCQYEIQLIDENVKIQLTWQKSGESQTLSFGGKIDAVTRDIDSPPGAKVSFAVVAGNALESRLYIDGREVAYSKRVASDDGLLLAVLQINRGENGGMQRISQVYRRIPT